jgi:hypothetical protein
MLLLQVLRMCVELQVPFIHVLQCRQGYWEKFVDGLCVHDAACKRARFVRVSALAPFHGPCLHVSLCIA